ncbi:hypothetical protein E2C01_014347 [Portunus trituberculatus]|uniref:Uncharacterized protein n=1 Tax=Portunus trituberculatus TaxID=210409 RepID=A0A5B7DJT3_PORTR|nr:hypothetical protein [Portunus trituberculatus]
MRTPRPGVVASLSTHKRQDSVTSKSVTYTNTDRIVYANTGRRGASDKCLGFEGPLIMHTNGRDAFVEPRPTRPRSRWCHACTEATHFRK